MKTGYKGEKSSGIGSLFACSGSLIDRSLHENTLRNHLDCFCTLEDFGLREFTVYCQSYAAKKEDSSVEYCQLELGSNFLIVGKTTQLCHCLCYGWEFNHDDV